MTTSRRQLLGAVGAVSMLPIAGSSQTVARKGRLKQSVTKGCFARNTPMEDICRESARLGLKGVDLIGPADWPLLKTYGLLSTMCPGSGNICHKDKLEANEKTLAANILLAADAGMPNVIVTTGSRDAMSDEEGIENCANLLNRVKKLAEDRNVSICMEMLNTKVNHKGYWCDSTRLAVEVCKRAPSPRVKLLYDIYHMQIMEGDVIRTIRDNIQYIGHFHTGGNPGRHEIDDTQELNYRAIASAIVEAGFTGYLAHEYNPARDPLKSLDQAISICDV